MTPQRKWCETINNAVASGLSSEEIAAAMSEEFPAMVNMQALLDQKSFAAKMRALRVIRIKRLVNEAEALLGTLSDGQMRDLVLDNFSWIKGSDEADQLLREAGVYRGFCAL